MDQRCRWPGCTNPVSNYLLMCPEHWRRLPKKHRHAIWATCRPRPGDGFPAGSFIDAVSAALAWARRAAREAPKNEPLHDLGS
jgi:hypothetical protein